ncbi:hypothetical protein NFI96_018199, partial [Prochilodus magdalenae]
VLVLISVFFTKGLALRCHDCLTHIPHSCEPRECPFECNNLRITGSLGGMKLDSSMRTCLPPLICVKGRINTGLIKATINSKCCQTDNCNNQELPALPIQGRNGKKCCANSNCSKKVFCEGDEDHCIDASVVPVIFEVNIKGCVSKGICDGLVPISNFFSFPAKVLKCCKGNLCNRLL